METFLLFSKTIQPLSTLNTRRKVPHFSRCVMWQFNEFLKHDQVKKINPFARRFALPRPIIQALTQGFQLDCFQQFRSTYLIPNEYHFFNYHENFLRGKHFHNNDEVEKCCARPHSNFV